MYIRTPKRYRRTARRSIVPWPRFLLITVLIGLIVGGIWVYRHRETIQPQVDRVAMQMVNEVNIRAATAVAPPPTPTADPTVNLANGHNAWQRGDVTTAMIAYEQIRQSVPNDVELHTRLTYAMLTRGEIEKGLEQAEWAVTADPFSADAWAAKAAALVWAGEYTSAISSAYQALDLQQDHPGALAFLGYAYWGNDQDERALTFAERAIAANPDRFEGHYVRALILDNAYFNFAEALTAYQRAYDLARTQNPALVGTVSAGMALVMNYQFSDGERAVGILEDARSIDPDHTLVLYTLGSVLYNQGNFGPAQGPLEECVQVDPVDANCHYLLGRTHEKNGDQQAALAAFEEAIEAGIERANAYWWAAEMHRALGSCTQAIPYIELGYRMVIPGDLPASDEGNELLIDDFEFLRSQCRVS